MSDDTLLLIGRDTGRARGVYETHAARLRDRDVADSVQVVTYGTEPGRDLREAVAGLDGDRTYAVPMCVAHTHETIEAVPRALSTLENVQYCEPIGRSPAITRAVLDRAAEKREIDPSTTLVLVGLGNTTGGYHREVAEYHASHADERSAFAGVQTCYLLQNPAVECVRYNVPTESATAVPLFVAACAATEEQIPAKLELDRPGLAYADPLGTHPGVTDAVHDRLETTRALAESTAEPRSFEATLTGSSRPLATDGEGRPL